MIRFVTVSTATLLIAFLSLIPLSSLAEAGGDLDLHGTRITELPNNLKVSGLQGTGVTKLPDYLSVGGFLDLYGTGITEPPDHLKVGGDLDLRDTRITKLPNNLKVGGQVLRVQSAGVH